MLVPGARRRARRGYQLGYYGSYTHCILTRKTGRVNLALNERCSTSFIGAPGTQVPGPESISASRTPALVPASHDRTQVRRLVQVGLSTESHGAYAPKDDAQT